MIYRHHRAKVGTVECTVDLCCLVTAVTSVRSIPVSVVVDGLQPHLQPIGDVRSQVQVDIETAVLIVVMFQCSPLVEETYRTVIGGLARTSVETGVYCCIRVLSLMVSSIQSVLPQYRYLLGLDGSMNTGRLCFGSV